MGRVTKCEVQLILGPLRNIAVPEHAKSRRDYCDSGVCRRCFCAAARRGFRPAYWPVSYRRTVLHSRARSPSLYMRANPNDQAQPESGPSLNSALLYPNLALPAIFQNIFFPADSSPWPFGYEQFSRRRLPKRRASRISGCVSRRSMPTPSSDAFAARLRRPPSKCRSCKNSAARSARRPAILAKACPNEIPAQPVARLQLMESQIEELAMAIDIVRQPLQDFEQSLTPDQQAKLCRRPRPPLLASHGQRSEPGRRNMRLHRLRRIVRRQSIGRSIRSTNRFGRPTRSGRLGRCQRILRQGGGRPAGALSGFGAADCARPAGSHRGSTRRDMAFGVVDSGRAGKFRNQIDDDQQKGRFDAMNFAAR